MVKFRVHVSNELKQKMDQTVGVDWSDVARKAFEKVVDAKAQHTRSTDIHGSGTISKADWVKVRKGHPGVCSQGSSRKKPYPRHIPIDELEEMMETR